MDTSLTDAALGYESLGLPIVRFAARSKYAGEGLRDLQWQSDPVANVGVALGRVSGLVLLDLDFGKGVADATDVKRRYGPLPRTATVVTAHGLHLFYRNVAPLAVVFDTVAAIVDSLVCDLGYLGQALARDCPLHGLGLAPGVELMGERSATALPPSVHPSGSVYRFVDCDAATLRNPADPPAWLVRAAEASLARLPEIADQLRTRLPELAERSRHDWRRRNGHTDSE